MLFSGSPSLSDVSVPEQSSANDREKAPRFPETACLRDVLGRNRFQSMWARLIQSIDEDAFLHGQNQKPWKMMMQRTWTCMNPIIICLRMRTEGFLNSGPAYEVQNSRRRSWNLLLRVHLHPQPRWPRISRQSLFYQLVGHMRDLLVNNSISVGFMLWRRPYFSFWEIISLLSLFWVLWTAVRFLLLNYRMVPVESSVAGRDRLRLGQCSTSI